MIGHDNVPSNEILMVLKMENRSREFIRENFLFEVAGASTLIKPLFDGHRHRLRVFLPRVL